MTIKPHEISVGPDRLEEIPVAPGVYLFIGGAREGGESKVLYVGKSKKLRSRVRHYFQGEGDGRAFIRFIQAHTVEIRTLVVHNEHEALILENELIKKYKPPYNILLKDDKRYLSIRVDLSHEWPKMEMVRRIRKDKAFYLGPFSSASQLRITLDFMQKMFPLRTCSDHKLYNRSRPCLEYDIKRCLAPCVGYIDKESYKVLVQSAIAFLKGQEEAVLQDLRRQMDLAAHQENYEEAARLRDRIQAIETTIEGKGILGMEQQQRELNQDVLGIAESGDKTVIVLMFVRHGLVLDKRAFEFDALALDRDSLVLEFLQRYYSSEVFVPDEILVPHIVDSGLLEIEVPVLIPRSEEKRRFLTLAHENALRHLEAAMERQRKNASTLAALQTTLNLTRIPLRMDCVDISHHQGLENVASVVRFYEGLPDKSLYRKIKMSLDQVDDFHSMKEALERRYKTKDDLPDLLVIDGGKGQLSAALDILKAKDFLDCLDIVSLAKARDGETIDPLNPQNRERVFKPGQKNPLLLKAGSPSELLLSRLRDEAHRFAISFHRDRKTKMISRSALDAVPGLTLRLKTQLLNRFQSIDQILLASDDELEQELPRRVVRALRLTLRDTAEKIDS